MENLNCHNKVFFQDLSLNSLSFLLKWLSRARVSHKSRVGIVIQNRWTLNHRWCLEGAKQSLLLREEGKGEGGKNSLHPLEKHQVLFCSGTWALVPYCESINTVTGFSETVGLVFLLCTLNSTFLISCKAGQRGILALLLGGEQGMSFDRLPLSSPRAPLQTHRPAHWQWWELLDGDLQS